MNPTGNVRNAADLPKPLAEKVALVTGGSRGIGKAIAQKLAALGADVAICGRNEDLLKRTAREIESLGVRVHAQKADVSRNSDVTLLVQATEKKLGPISILVNNAGIGMFGPVYEKSEEDWDGVMNTNLKSVFLATRAVAPGMIARKSGDIVNISSLAGKNTFAGGALYCASKWGLQGLTGCMAEDLRGFGIRVSAICPGSVATEFSGRGPKDPSKVLTAEDVAHAVAMVVTQGAQSFIREVDLRPVGKPGAK
ncbi:MAG TPA: SDR family oxidoreductase [Candidatus Acidoferrum sp.]|jgi:NAD(P)-dependent dehydrogenase (short-subunit alcohol dehydrogenase family)